MRVAPEHALKPNINRDLYLPETSCNASCARTCIETAAGLILTCGAACIRFLCSYPLASPPPVIPLPSKMAFWRTESALFGVFMGGQRWGNGLCAESLLWPFRGLVAAGGLRAAGSGAIVQGGQGVASQRVPLAEEAQGNEPVKRVAASARRVDRSDDGAPAARCLPWPPR